MKNFLHIIGIFALMVMTSFGTADFYSSMTKVDYVEGSKTLKFTTKMNTQHISDAIKINPNTAGFEAEVKKYVNNNFDICRKLNTKQFNIVNIAYKGSQKTMNFQRGKEVNEVSF